MRKLLTKILSVIVAVTATLGLVMLPKTTVQASEFTFAAKQGASVKFGDTIEETGLRFTIEVDKEFYATLGDVEFGALLTTKKYADANGVSLDDNSGMVANVCYVNDATKFDAEADSENYVYYASVTYLFNEEWKNEVVNQFASTGLSDEEIFAKAKLAALATELVCRPYYIANGEVFYAEPSDARSMLKVANAAVIDGEKVTADFVSKYLSIVEEVEAYVSAEGTVEGLNIDLEGATFTAGADAGNIAFDINTYFADKTEGEYYYVTAFKGSKVYRIKFLYVTKFIDEAEDLKVFAMDGVREHNEIKGYYLVTKDIDASALVLNDHKFVAGAIFPGDTYKTDVGFNHATFDGQGHVIDGLTVKSNGLFGCMNASTIKNIAFTNVNLTGYYKTLFTHSVSRGKDYNNDFTNIEALFENIYISIASIATGGETRVGVLANNTLPTAVSINNVIVEYSNVDENRQALINQGKSFYLFGSSGLSTAKADTYSNSYAISTAPVLASSKMLGFAENQVAFTTNEKGNEVISVEGVIDEQVNEILSIHNKTLTIDNVLMGLRAYDNYSAMSADSEANAESLATFDSKYWVVVNGVPYWKTSYAKLVDLVVTDAKGNVVTEDIILGDTVTKYTVNLFDGVANLAGLEISAPQGVLVNGNVIGLESDPTSVGEYEITISAVVDGLTIEKTLTIGYSNAFDIDGKVLYSAYDKALDIDSLNAALAAAGQAPITKEQITGYIVGGETVEELELEVIITGAIKNKYVNVTYERTVDTAQTAAVCVGNKTYLLSNVYAYTMLVDELADLDYFSRVSETLEDGTVLYNAYEGYYLMTKNIDGTAKGEGGANYKLAGPADNVSATKKSAGLKGVFDGNGYTISNMTFTCDGLFGQIYGGILRNVAFVNIATGGYYPSLIGRNISYTSFNNTRCYPLVENVYVEGTTFPANKAVAIIAYQAVNADIRNLVVKHTLSEVDKASILAARQHGVFGFQLTYSKSKNYQDIYVIGDLPMAIQFSSSNATRNNFVFAGNVLKLKDGSETEYEVADKETFAFLHEALNAKYTANEYTWSPTVPATDTLWTIDYMPYVKQYISVEAMAKEATDNAASLAKFSTDCWNIVNGVPVWKNL